MRLALVSDIHYAGPGDRQRPEYLAQGIRSPLGRAVLKAYRHFVWLRDPFAHNHLLNEFLVREAGADLAVANGDYALDSAFIGVSDPPTRESATECLRQLRSRFGDWLETTIGDHELGKTSMGGGLGGPRLASFHCARAELGLRPFWQRNVGRYVLMGVTSTLVALPVFDPELLPQERPEWQQLRDAHQREIREAFQALESRQRVLLFCHDPTALPFLWREDAVRARLPQVERTIIGHLHTRVVLWKSRLLAGMPVVRFLGTTPRRLSTALNEARHWQPFKILLCPALAGTELFKDGGYYTAVLDPDATRPVEFQFHRLRR